MLKRFLILCLPLVIVFYGCSSKAKKPSEQLCFSDGCVFVEIAQTPEERTKGLQGRKQLAKDRGMLFIFSESQKYSFWMEDTLIALDIIWLDHNKRIVTIMSDILPCETEQCPVYTPDHEARYVLEINSGAAIDLGLKIGDQAVF